MRLSLSCLAFIVPLSLIWACGSSSGDLGDAAAESGGSDAAAGSLGFGGDEGSITLGGSKGSGFADGGASPGDTVNGGSSSAGGVVATGTTACSNGIDDDGDGLIDGFDPECTGPADNDEGSYATGIPGDNRDPKWQDCFFDGNSGAGDDNCRYATGCLTGDLPPDDKNCKLTDSCIKFCAPRTPNGCDCFGCCTVQTAGGDAVDIETSASCSLDKIDDTDACPRCVKSDACGNTCGRCELCPGKTVAELPADCGSGTGGSGGSGGSSSGGSSSTGGTGSAGGPAYTCDGGEQVCGPDLPACSLGQYCSLGCCLLQPPR